MAKQVIDIGTTPNDLTGDPLRDAYIKINQNFDEVYPLLPTADEKAALPGPEGHAPHAGNKYVTVSYLTQQLGNINSGINLSASNRVLGRITDGAGPSEELTGTQVTTLLDPFTSVLKGVVPPSGGGTANFLRADGVWAAPPDNDTTYGVFTSTVNGLAPASGGGTTKYLRADGTWQVPPDTDTNTTYEVFTSTVNGLAPASGGGTTKYLRADGTWQTPPNTTYSVFTGVSNGLAPASGGGMVNFLRADGVWAAPPDTTYGVFTSGGNGLAPASGGGTTNFLRADGVWAAPPASGGGVTAIGTINGIAGNANGAVISGSTLYMQTLTSTLPGLAPASGGGTVNYLRADGTWATPPNTTYGVFTSGANGLTPASGGGTSNFLRADGTWTAPPNTTYSVFTSSVSGLVPASGGGTTNFLRADGTWQAVSSTSPAGQDHEMQKKTPSALTLSPTGIYSDTDGNILLGHSDQAGSSRVITSRGVDPLVGIKLITKGGSVFTIESKQFELRNTADGGSSLGSVGDYIKIMPPYQFGGASIIVTKQLWGGAFVIRSAAGTSTLNDGDDIQFSAGSAYGLSGNGNGGNISFTSGAKNGTGSDGDILFNSLSRITRMYNRSITHESQGTSGNLPSTSFTSVHLYKGGSTSNGFAGTHSYYLQTGAYGTNTYIGGFSWAIEDLALGKYKYVTSLKVGASFIDRIVVNSNGVGINTTPSAAFHALGSARLDLGSDATGDIFYRSSTGVLSRLPIGTNGQVLTLSSGLPSWQNPSGTGISDGDKGDITVSLSGTSWTVDPNVVTYAKMQDISTTSRVLGRISAGSGDPEELTGAQVTTILSTFTSTLKGVVPASGGSSSHFLRADGVWAAPPTSGVTTIGTLDAFARVSNGATISGTSLHLQTFGATKPGLVAASGGGTTNFLRADGVWAAPPAGGGGVTTIGTIDSQAKSTNGAVISGSSLYMQTADTTRPGLVSTGTQAFAGIKTFNNRIGVGATSISSTMMYVKGDGSLSNLFRAEDSGGSRVFSISESGNIVMNTIGFLNGPSGVFALGNVRSAPGAIVPSTGGFLYSEGGALKWKGSSGTVTTIANA